MGNYYIRYFNLYLSSSDLFAQKILDENLGLLSNVANNSEKQKIANICNLALKKGARLNLPILKVRPKTVNGNKENWIYDFENNQVIESVEVYDFLINSPNVSQEDKCKLDSILIQSMMADLVLLNYNNKSNYLSKYLDQKMKKSIKSRWIYSAMEELENILCRGHVFNNQVSSFLTLSSIFSYREIFDNLGTQFKVNCFQEFSKLNIIGKKALTSMLIKSRNEEAIFNLLSYGLKLNWDIPTEDGKKNLVVFEMLYSLQWVKAFIENQNLDIRLTNSRGENILHLIGSSALSDSSIEESLRRRIVELNPEERSNIFFQLNEENMTPLMKAVVFQDEKIINFISEFNIKPWDELDGAPSYKSPMELLNDYILRFSEKSAWGCLMDYFKDSFWVGLAKKWNSEFYYKKLQKDLIEKSPKTNRKAVKI